MLLLHVNHCSLCQLVLVLMLAADLGAGQPPDPPRPHFRPVPAVLGVCRTPLPGDTYHLVGNPASCVHVHRGEGPSRGQGPSGVRGRRTINAMA